MLEELRDLGKIRGREGTFKTLQEMRKLVLKASQNPMIYNLARYLVQSIPSEDKYNRASRIFEFVRDYIDYVNDPLGTELLRSPEIVLKERNGDCDEKATLLASLYRAVGFPVAFVVCGPDPEHFKHVYVAVKVGNWWLTADPTVPWAYLGWQQSIYPHKEVFAIDEGVKPDIRGLDFDIEDLLKKASSLITGVVSKVKGPVEKVYQYVQAAETAGKELPKVPQYTRTGMQIHKEKEETKKWWENPRTKIVMAVLAGIIVRSLFKK